MALRKPSTLETLLGAALLSAAGIAAYFLTKPVESKEHRAGNVIVREVTDSKELANAGKMLQEELDRRQEKADIESAWSLYFSRDYKNAIQRLEPIAKKHNKAMFYAMLGYCFTQLGEFEKSEEMYKKAGELSPNLNERDTFEVRVRKNKRYYAEPEQGKKAELLELADKAIECEIKGDYKNALKFAKEASDRYPDSFYPYQIMASTSIALKDFRAAQDCYDNAIMRRPEDFIFHIGFIRSLLNLNPQKADDKTNIIKKSLPYASDDIRERVLHECRIINMLHPNYDPKEFGASSIADVREILGIN